MLNRVKSSIFVVSAVTIFVLGGWMLSSPSVETLALGVDEQPGHITSEDVSVAAEPARPQQPSMTETIQQSSLNWADYAQPTSADATVSETSMGETIREASLNWADYTNQEPSMAETIQQASLNWANYTEAISNESAVAEPSMGETIQQASLNWADYSNVIDGENKLPEPNYDEANGVKPY